MKTFLRRLLGRSSRAPRRVSATRRQRRSIRGYIERFEDRLVLSPVIAPMHVEHAETATLNGTTLRIIGDNTDDTIDLALVANGVGIDDDQVTVTLNGTDAGTFTLADIKLISINSFGGDDTITADAEITTRSQIVTGEGNDDVTSSDGNDLIKAGKGFDTVDGGNGRNTIIGALGDDSLTGGDGTDVIRAGHGDDTVDAGDGSNTVNGGKGADDLTGGDGTDRLIGLSGDDIMSGGAGNDRMYGGLGDDSMLGEAGNDKMVGGPGFREGGRFSTRTQDGNDTMDGGDGNDRMNGGLGSDSMTGGAGNDRIKGGPKFMEGATDQDGNDNINGGDGNDRINGGFGTDTLNGGAGEDTIHGGGHPDGNSSKDTITRDFMDNGLKGVATFDEPGAPRHSTLCPGADNIPGNTDDPDVSTAPCHVTGTIDYAGMGFSNPPTYGPNHADRTASGSDLGSPVQPTGIHIDVALDDADLVHNLEVGHIWISYDPAHVTQGEINKLRDIVRSIANDANGAGAGIILTERPANDDAKPIAVASWGHLLKLDHVDGEAIRSFYNHNKGTAPVAFTKP